VVVSDVPPYTIFGGNPAKRIRQRFDDQVILSLLKVAWWDWDIGKITRNLEKIVSTDIEALMNCE
jgi:virginiamycin A acetyltransferase